MVIWQKQAGDWHEMFHYMRWLYRACFYFYWERYKHAAILSFPKYFICFYLFLMLEERIFVFLCEWLLTHCITHMIWTTLNLVLFTINKNVAKYLQSCSQIYILVNICSMKEWNGIVTKILTCNSTLPPCKIIGDLLNTRQIRLFVASI